MISHRPFPITTHLNGNMMCAIDIETTGLDWNKHDIIEVAVLPLDNQYKPQKKCMPFSLTMRPRRPENVNLDALSISKSNYAHILNNSLESSRVADLFVEWFEKLNLGFNRRLSPLGHNYPFDRNFLIDWLGPLTYDLIFDSRFRDTMATALYINDVADMQSQRIPYAKVNLSWLAKQHNIDHKDAHSALPDCRITAEVYRALVMTGANVLSSNQQVDEVLPIPHVDHHT